MAWVKANGWRLFVAMWMVWATWTLHAVSVDAADAESAVRHLRPVSLPPQNESLAEVKLKQGEM
ncbi:hypothetical protein [Cupriavidus basilensis]|uniref:Uncharacterized protein n=1 Tax=Cupriavidus basilensis TaxID=68895 RepID=A0A643FSJ8_9BURK|nr:hypothetical protein [Cupriavidus basilensis]QOT82215.1 hypothetical protein F7R26_039580 [Cupriavidus basilensis]